MKHTVCKVNAKQHNGLSHSKFIFTRVVTLFNLPDTIGSFAWLNYVKFGQRIFTTHPHVTDYTLLKTRMGDENR